MNEIERPTAAPPTGRVELGERPNTESSPTTAATRWQATLEAEKAAILDFVVDGKIGDPSPPAVVDDPRECTCHPDDNPPRPCPRKFAYSECVKAAAVVDYTEWARELFAAHIKSGCVVAPDFIEHIAAALSAVASEHIERHLEHLSAAHLETAEALAKLASAMAVVEATIRFRDDATGSNETLNAIWDSLDALVITEKLT